MIIYVKLFVLIWLVIYSMLLLRAIEHDTTQKRPKHRIG